MPIAIDIVERAAETAAAHGATRICEIDVEVGEMRQVVPEALQLAFSMAAQGTCAEGARLQIIDEKAMAVCNCCGCTFVPEIDIGFVCPECEQADARIVAGNDIILRTVVCDADEEVSA